MWCRLGNFGPIRTFAEYATPDQKARFMGDLLGGKSVISLGMTEPEAGSAVTELRSTATLSGEEVILNGTKIFSTHSPDASVFLVYVRFAAGLDGIGSVLVERNSPDLRWGSRPASWEVNNGASCISRIAAFRKPTCCLGRAASKSRLRDIQRRAHRQFSAFAGAWALRLQPCARICHRPQAIRPAALRVPGVAVEVCGHGAGNSNPRSFCSTAPQPTPKAGCRRPTKRR